MRACAILMCAAVIVGCRAGPGGAGADGSPRTVITWHDNGQMYTQTTYVGGVPDGWQYEWSPDGNLERKRLWSRGVLVDRWKAAE